MAKQNIYLSSKPRYEILDGLRGVGALVVILFHCFETYAPVLGRQVCNHGYLAVDFFFVLSGFVIGYAYDDRWDRMTTWGFFKRRLVRLHPMVVAGTVIGASLFFFGDCEPFAKISTCPAWKFALCFVMGLLMIPCGPRLDIRGWMETNSFNGPNWSLTWEYLGNILYAFLFRRLPQWGLMVVLAIGAFLTLNLTLGWDLFGVFDQPKYDVIGGWALDAPNLVIGFTRLLYPFVCGILLSRLLAGRRSDANPSGSPLHARGGFWWCSLILVVLFALPLIGGKSGMADGLYQAVCLLLVFPLVVLLGAGSTTTDVRTTRFCRFLGELSYPLYITHFPFMYMQMSWAWRHPDAPAWMHISVSLGVVVMSLITAWATYKLYDLPVRAWLTDHWLKRKPSASREAKP